MECNKKESVPLSRTMECCCICKEVLCDCYQCGRAFHDSSLVRINDGEPTCPKCLAEIKTGIII